jgi:hypothetical protein
LLTLTDLTQRTADLLQDPQGVRWLPAEVERYLFDSQHEFIRLSGFPRMTSSVQIAAGTTEFARPANPPLLELVKARISGSSIEVPIVTSAVLDESQALNGVNIGTNWRTDYGSIRAIVLDSASASHFRVWPTPNATAPLFHSSLMKSLRFNPIPQGDGSMLLQPMSVPFQLSNLFSQANIDFEGPVDAPRNAINFNGLNTPMIGSAYHEYLVYGAAEKAYLKENELRNVEKAGLFRQKFLEGVKQALQKEQQNTLTRNVGANKKRMKVARAW